MYRMLDAYSLNNKRQIRIGGVCNQQNIFNTGNMHESQAYLSIIRTIATKIRDLHYQNGFSQNQVDLFLMTAVAQHFGQSPHAYTSLRQFLATVLSNSQNSSVVLIRIIESLQIQLFILSTFAFPSLQSSKSDPNQNIENRGEHSFSLSHEDLEKNGKLNCLRSKPRSSKSKIELDIEKDDSESDLDLIQESIRETLERTKKLKAYLSFKSKQESEREGRRKYEGRVHNFGALYE